MRVWHGRFKRRNQSDSPRHADTSRHAGRRPGIHVVLARDMERGGCRDHASTSRNKWRLPEAGISRWPGAISIPNTEEERRATEGHGVQAVSAPSYVLITSRPAPTY
jgi:hypothetical protein